MDMGGTSFDVSFIKSGQVSFTTEGSVGGHAMAFPVLDIRTVGAGGGSIAVVDEGGVLQVGPAERRRQSRADLLWPRRRCEPTVTDADLVLGYLGADDFLGGKFRLDSAAAEKGIAEKIAGTTRHRHAACGGGNQPTGQQHHGGRYSARLHRRRVRPAPMRADRRRRRRRGSCRGDRAGVRNSHLAHPAGGVGVLRRRNAVVRLFKHDFVRTLSGELTKFSPKKILRSTERWRRKRSETLAVRKVVRKEDIVELSYGVDLKYVGQFHEVTIPFGGPPSETFHRAQEGLRCPPPPAL